MTRPVIDLLVDPRVVEPVRPVLGVLSTWATVRAARPGSQPPPAARFATSPSAPGLAEALADAAVPVAVWVPPGTDLSPLQAAAVLVGPVPADGVVAVPAEGLDARAWAPVPPFVRRTWRRRFGLDPALVVATEALPEDLVPSALALAAAAVVPRRHLLAALALGCPVVTTAEAAAAVGALDGEHLVVAEPGGPSAEAAARVAGDEREAARLSTAGRRLVEQTSDVVAPARAVASALGLTAAAPLERALAGLGTPLWAAPAARAAALVGSLGAR